MSEVLEADYEGVTHAGLALVRDGALFLAQRALDESDDPEVRETWEFPGGGLEDGEDPQAGAFREFEEEVGPLGECEVVHGWRSGNYQGFVAEASTPPEVGEFTPNEEVQAVGWFTPEEADRLPLRPEVAALDLADLASRDVSRNMEASVSTEDLDDEPEFEARDFDVPLIPIHGVLAPEGIASGDGRGFLENALTARPLPHPLGWQKVLKSGHEGSVTTGSIERLMRKDGLVHFEGWLLDTPEADELAQLIAHFGRYGLSLDGDKTSFVDDDDDDAATDENGVVWFDGTRVAGATACSVPAFPEAYIALGPHPDMPAEDDAETMAPSAGSVAFRRGAGWVTNPKETSRLHRYWTEKGQPGYAKVRWGTPGDFRRAKALIGEKIAKNSPDKMRFLNQIIAQWHFDALGYWPGELDKPGNKTSAQAKAERALTSDGMVEALHDASAALNENLADTDWSPVLTASVGGERVLPPAAYFDRHPEGGPLTIEAPDENGFRRVFGYVGEWGVCHLGFDDQCVLLPKDPTGGYEDYRLGQVETDAGHINTGLITYAVSHRGARRILSESAQQAHYDDVKSAWAAVVTGEDERGVWFSGVVLPSVPEEDLTLIQAAGQVSGEWKREALRSLLAVNVPGFPVRRSSATIDEGGEVESLVASVGGKVADAPCSEEPAETGDGDFVRDLAREVRAQMEADDAMAANLKAAEASFARSMVASVEGVF